MAGWFQDGWWGPQSSIPPPPSGGGTGWFPRGWWTAGWFAAPWWGSPGGAVMPPPPLSIRQAVVAALLADPTLSSLVSGEIYPFQIDQEATLPAVTYQFVSFNRKDNRSLDSTNPITRARVQIAGVSKLLRDSQAIAEACRQIFDGFTGPLAAYGPIVVETILDDERDLFEGPTDGTGRAMCRIVQDIVIRYREPVPARFNS